VLRSEHTIHASAFRGCAERTGAHRDTPYSTHLGSGSVWIGGPGSAASFSCSGRSRPAGRCAREDASKRRAHAPSGALGTEAGERKGAQARPLTTPANDEC
jgi:hypothetical protein